MHACFILLENLCMRNQEVNLHGRQMVPGKGVVGLLHLKATFNTRFHFDSCPLRAVRDPAEDPKMKKYDSLKELRGEMRQNIIKEHKPYNIEVTRGLGVRMWEKGLFEFWLCCRLRVWAKLLTSRNIHLLILKIPLIS